MKQMALSTLCSALAMTTLANPYKFDWDERKDMQSAWLMCATTGFVLGECPKVFAQCWKPPLIYLKRHRAHFHVKTHCVKLPSWQTSDTEIQKVIEYAAHINPDTLHTPTRPRPSPDQPHPFCRAYPNFCATEDVRF